MHSRHIDAERAVLSINDTWLDRVIEAHRICPFARPCRTHGKLMRRVMWQTAPDVDAAMRAIAEFEADACADAEIGLLIFPNLATVATKTFDSFHVAVREAYEARWGDGQQFYLVPFHPQYAFDDGDAHRLVRFWRKSPDPAFQFVRIAVLDAVRGTDRAAAISHEIQRRLADGTDIDEVLTWLEAQKAPVALADQVSQDNFRTMQRHRRGAFEAILTEINELRHRAYAAAGLNETAAGGWADSPWTRIADAADHAATPA